MSVPLIDEELKRLAAGKKAIGDYALREFAHLASDPEGDAPGKASAPDPEHAGGPIEVKTIDCCQYAVRGYQGIGYQRSYQRPPIAPDWQAELDLGGGMVRTPRPMR